MPEPRRPPDDRDHPPAHRATIDPLVSAGGGAEPHDSRGVFHDVWVIARRGLIHMKRQPEQLSDATIQPIMFVLLFAFVFGGAITVPGCEGRSGVSTTRSS